MYTFIIYWYVWDALRNATLRICIVISRVKYKGKIMIIMIIVKMIFVNRLIRDLFTHYLIVFGKFRANGREEVPLSVGARRFIVSDAS